MPALVGAGRGGAVGAPVQGGTGRLHRATPRAERIGESGIGRIPRSSILHFAIEGGFPAAAYSTLQSTEGTLTNLRGRNKTIMIHFSDRTCRARSGSCSIVLISSVSSLAGAQVHASGRRGSRRKCTSARGSSPQPLK